MTLTLTLGKTEATGLFGAMEGKTCMFQYHSALLRIYKVGIYKVWQKQPTHQKVTDTAR